MTWNRTIFIVGFNILVLLLGVELAKNKQDVIQRISDLKEFKKFVRTHTNVLVVFAKTERDIPSGDLAIFSEAAHQMRGVGHVVLVDCSSDQKPCKKLRSSPRTYELKHFRAGDFHKVYDRQLTVKSMCNFLRDPTGDLPWEEDPTATDVVHLDTRAALMKIISKEKRPMMIMFYAPWCGHCKHLKPQFAAAATELKDSTVLAGMDVDRPENIAVRTEFNITGFPTLCYFEHSVFRYRYGGEHTKDGIINWLKDEGQHSFDVTERQADGIVEFIKNPREPPPPEQEVPWEDVPSEVVHLTEETFKTFTKKKKHVLVMFYAPWCGHCKQAKPEFMRAAEQFKDDSKTAFAAVDCTKFQPVCTEQEVTGYPTFKYFNYGKNDIRYTGGREETDFVRFMMDPLSPLSLSPPKGMLPEELWQEVDPARNVYHLTDAMFDAILSQHRSALVLFYAPWCGHCKAMKPAFAEAAASLKASSVDGILAAVDATVEKTLQARFGVTSFPTIKHFINGVDVEKYEMGRKMEDFVAFMKSKQSPHEAASVPASKDDIVHGMHQSDQLPRRNDEL